MTKSCLLLEAAVKIALEVLAPSLRNNTEILIILYVICNRTAPSSCN